MYYMHIVVAHEAEEQVVKKATPYSGVMPGK